MRAHMLSVCVLSLAACCVLTGAATRPAAATAARPALAPQAAAPPARTRLDAAAAGQQGAWPAAGFAGGAGSPAAAGPRRVLPGMTAIAAGSSHTCALTAGGGVLCWGWNQYGQLGDGTRESRLAPVAVSGLTRGVQAIAAGYGHTCALTAGGGVLCWGWNQYGQLGDGTTATAFAPVAVRSLSSGVQAIAAGFGHTCALTTGGGVVCWGDNNNGQLGDGTGEDHLAPVDVSGLTRGVQAIAGGFGHTCALTTGGGAKCWGASGRGQLGDGTMNRRLAPVDVSGLTSGVQAIAAGDRHTCALTTGGAKCWGWDEDGQVGDGATAPWRLAPVDVSVLTQDVQALAPGYYHTCALTTSGGVLCWGDNEAGQLGDGTTAAYRLAPVAVSGLSRGVQALAGGENHTCALTTDGGVLCWGSNDHGQVGDGTPGVRLAPVAVSGLSRDVQAIAAGGSRTCALTTGGGVLCWGGNHWLPVGVSGLSRGVQAIAASGSHTCALTTDGGVLCWGSNYFGQLGDGTTVDRPTPVAVSGLSRGVQAIAAGYGHTCALTTGGGVQCWGWNEDGQVGDGTTDDRLAPVDVSGLTRGVQAIAAGDGHTCALTTGGGVKCWGSNNAGQLGDGTTDWRPALVDVSGLTNGVQAITAGDRRTCALTTGGGVKCWGWNHDGQLGDGTTESRPTPVDVSGLTSGVQAISGVRDHTCALTVGGGVQCWGANLYGQLGDGTRESRLAPVDVSGLSRAVQAIAASRDHTCALTTGGGVLCWGANDQGQLGVNPGWTPVAVINLVAPQVFLPDIRP